MEGRVTEGGRREVEGGWKVEEERQKERDER